MDPLEESDFLQAIRSAYFHHLPLDPGSDGIDDYLRYRVICLELLAAHEVFAGADGGTHSIDWEAFGTSQSPHVWSRRSDARRQLAWLALELLESEQSEED